MKKISILIVCLFAIGIAAAAQESKIGHTVQLGAGAFIETNKSAEPGLALRVAYALNVPISASWSVEPSIGVRGQRSDLAAWFKGAIGRVSHSMVVGELFCAIKYQMPLGHSFLELGIAPGAIYSFSHQKYHFDAEPLPTDPMSKISGKPIFKDFDLGLRPSVLFRINHHWGVGLEATIGLLQAKVQYPEYPVGETRLNSVMLVGAYRF